MPALNGELTCLLCNDVLGYVTEGIFRPTRKDIVLRAGRRPRCPRCGGSVYFDEETHPAVALGSGGLANVLEA